jgi:hypothetical protein
MPDRQNRATPHADPTNQHTLPKPDEAEELDEEKEKHEGMDEQQDNGAGPEPEDQLMR